VTRRAFFSLSLKEGKRFSHQPRVSRLRPREKKKLTGTASEMGANYERAQHFNRQEKIKALKKEAAEAWKNRRRREGDEKRNLTEAFYEQKKKKMDSGKATPFYCKD